MKVRSLGKSQIKGASTLELLIAFAVLISTISASILVSIGNQSAAVDSQTNAEALYRAHALLEDSRAVARQDFSLVVATTSTEIVGGLSYEKTLGVTDHSQCKKLATSKISWNKETTRPQMIELETYFTDITGARALGGDCTSGSPDSDWTNPQRFADDTFNPGKPTALDALNKFVYLGVDKSPFFIIASTTYATLGQSGNLILTSQNGFDLLDVANALDVVRNQATSKTYAYVAMNTVTDQLKVIDVTDAKNPFLAATRSLDSTLIPLADRVSGSNPQAKIIYYYDHKIYLGFSRTSGPEFHIYDVTDPLDPVWLGAREMNHNVNDIKVRGDYAFLAMTTSDSNDMELAILNISNPSNVMPHFVNGAPEEWGYNAAGLQDGLSTYLVGNKLYLGREQGSVTEPDLLILDVSSTTSAIPLLGTETMGADILEIQIADKFGFFGTSKTNQEFQIWNISSSSNISLIKSYNFGNNIRQGFDYDPDFIYASGQSTPNFQMLYSP
jgi:hypothetical protein